MYPQIIETIDGVRFTVTFKEELTARTLITSKHLSEYLRQGPEDEKMAFFVPIPFEGADQGAFVAIKTTNWYLQSDDPLTNQPRAIAWVDKLYEHGYVTHTLKRKLKNNIRASTKPLSEPLHNLN